MVTTTPMNWPTSRHPLARLLQGLVLGAGRFAGGVLDWWERQEKKGKGAEAANASSSTSTAPQLATGLPKLEFKFNPTEFGLRLPRLGQTWSFRISPPPSNRFRGSRTSVRGAKDRPERADLSFPRRGPV